MRGPQTTRDVVFARVSAPVTTPDGIGIVRHLGRVMVRVEVRGKVRAYHCAKLKPAI